MLYKTNNPLPGSFRKLSLILSSLILLISTSVLVGWVLDISILKSVSPSWVSMKANTALCFFLSAISIFFINRNNGKDKPFSKLILLAVSSGLIILIGFTSFSEYLLNFNAGIDELFFKDGNLIGTSHPGRMAPSTAICFMLFGFSFLLADNKKISFYFFQFCSLVAGVMAFVALMRYVYNTETIRGVMPFTGMAIHTSICFIFLMLATLYTHPEQGIMRMVSRNTYGGKHFRIVFPLSITLLIVPSIIQFYGVQNQLFEHNFATAILTILQVLSASSLLLISEHILSKSEMKLKQTEINLNSIFENTNTGYILLNTNLTIVSFNSRGDELIKKITGHSLLINTRLIKIIPPELHSVFFTRRSEVLKGESIHLEVPFPETSEGLIWYDLTGKPVKDEFDNIIGISLGINDITKSKKVIHELMESEIKFKSVLQSAKDSVILSDKEGKIIFWNNYSEKLFLYKKDEIIGKPFSTIIPKRYKLDYIQKLSQNLSLGRSRIVDKSMEVKGIRKDGTDFPMDLSLSSWTVGNETLYCGIIRDITERKKTEEEILRVHDQLQELTSHLQTIREEERTMIAREIHDELGQQLACIKMEAEWINRNTTDEGKLKETIGDMIALIADMVKSVRKISSELRPQMIDDLGLFAALEWKTSDFSLRTGIRCNLIIGQKEPTFITGAAIHIFRIFQESLTNSYKYAKASEINILINCEEGNLTMIIIDNGKGFDIEKAKQKKSFGLLGMKERAKILNGNIEIHSVIGEGTTIELRVPIIDKLETIPLLKNEIYA